MSDWQLLFTSDSPHQAHVWRSRLEAEGIAAEVVHKQNYGWSFTGTAGSYEVWVPLKDAPQALLSCMTTPPNPEVPSAKAGASNLQLRVMTALVGIVALVAALRFSEWGYAIVFGGLGLLCQLEFYTLLRNNGYGPNRVLGVTMGLVLFIATFLIVHTLDEGLSLVLLAPLAGLVYIRQLYKRSDKPFTDIALTFLGVLYPMLPFALLNLAAYPGGVYSWQIPLGLLILLWCSDSGAYFAGRSLGKTKLFERHSPKKTWEGFAGGLLGSAIAAGVLSYFWTDLSPTAWFGSMVLIVGIGTYGDLSESMLKRSLAIKDSGSILPGHGGFLDRFDGLLIALLFVVPLLLWLNS